MAGIGEPIRQQSTTLTSDGSGNASGTLTGVNGEIQCIKVALGSGMTTLKLTVATDTGQTALNAPTITTSKTITTRYTSTTNDGATDMALSVIKYFCVGTVTLTVTNATASKTVVVTVYYR